MALARATLSLRGANALALGGQCVNRKIIDLSVSCRDASSTRSGAILPEPKSTPFGIVGVVSGVLVGLLIGAAISKNIANFLEENDLFVPSDDDDDDD